MYYKNRGLWEIYDGTLYLGVYEASTSRGAIGQAFGTQEYEPDKYRAELICILQVNKEKDSAHKAI